MTFSPEQIVANEDWQKRHEGHEVVDEVKKFDLGDKAEKQLHWWHCKTCNKRHLHKMKTVEKGV